MSKKDEYFMSLALKEAKKGLGFTSSNPMVGAVIVKNGEILSTGYHKRFGEEHAEPNAINKLSKKELKGATIYVTLEPCTHFGKTPPCVMAIIDSGIKKVVIATEDIDKRVSGTGIEILKKSKIDVKVGVLKKEAKDLNSIYFFNKKNNKPYIVMKAALSLDGKIAASTGDSKWISCEKCRKVVHRLRSKLKAIAVGKTTVLEDKPKLNCRLKGFENKPVDKLVFSNEMIDTSSFEENPGKVHFIDKNISNSAESFIDFCNKNDIDSILIEGGSKIYSWFLEKGLVDRIYLFYRAGFIGDDGIQVLHEHSVKYVEDIKDFQLIDIKIVDNNFMVEMADGDPICLLD